MDESDRSRKAQRPEDLDTLLARLEVQEQIIQEQKVELASKQKEVTDLRSVGDKSSTIQSGSANMNRDYSSAFDGRHGGMNNSPGNRVGLYESGDDDFIQEQVNKHTFAQAVDADFYNDEGVSLQLPNDGGNNAPNFFRHSPLPRGQGYSSSPMWDQKPKSVPTGSNGLLAPPYWQPNPGQGYNRPAPEQDPVQDWKAGSNDYRRGPSGPPSGFHTTPVRQGFSPSPLSPPFVPNGSAATWNSAPGPNTPSSSMNSISLSSGYGGSMPYTGGYPQPSHGDYSSGFRGNHNNWSKSSNSSPTQPLGANLYGNSTESPNWKRLMERGVACDWGYLVDRVVMQNDQGASVFLQHKLKDFDHPEHKIEIINAIVDKAFPLMTNRFGNFLVQRCFEYGEPYHVEAMMKLIKNRVVQLSMDAFGCHVIQRALDTVPEPFKVMIIQELLHRIPETVMHRYACHVWQKLFEVRWVGNPPQVMKFMNEALAGMWPEIAMGETGSLVVQNIFENCLEEDKRPCVNEVLANLDMIARGQFGNWCIQHICEHGAPRDQSLALDMVLHNAVEYSMDQYASKVVEKCLKSSVAPGFLERYLERVCEGRPDRPRLPIIDIASDQYGNYLIQLILGTAPMHQREFVAGHIRKHMVSLRGSKFGSRVGMLCINNNFANFSSQPSPNPNRSGAGHGGHMHSGGGGHRSHWKGYR
ncbi:hypothetical protein TWF192_003373 [Orbilia oligospora]|uniref:Uncharacterized protein n=1 Tax=Orbilia oligospora TaxID=2813651 RepID=A0A6G1LR94_ORBOL|nr:hypothetical protein TWF191_003503 [Orbilia oligospora]KAF3231784.1 hypothetical protein TWF192_003373 [Orbilia oligospora]